MVIFWKCYFLLLACAFLCLEVISAEFLDEQHPTSYSCDSVLSLDGYSSKCQYLESVDNCVGSGYINYLLLFYCLIGRVPVLGYCILFLWTIALFYLLGNTAAEYFCPSLDSLSTLLKLSPTIAGATLLSFGNGAPDVFSSLASFTGSGTDNVGFNTVLGGASFVTCVVAGVISMLVRERQIEVDKGAFTRNIVVYILALVILLIIILIGKINLWGAIGILLTYIAYVIMVWCASDCDFVEDGSLREPILNRMENREVGGEEKCEPILNRMENGEVSSEEKCEPIDWCKRLKYVFKVILCPFATSLDLPRRLTIPSVCEKTWSKPIFVSSVTLAPIFLAVLWYFPMQTVGLAATLILFGIGIIVAMSLGIWAYAKTVPSSPPKDYLFIWLLASFLMSMIWSYIIAKELLGLLVSLGYIIGISPSILGFTVLAWGNSISDMIINSTMARKDDTRGTKIAIAGCLAGPIFNILFGLGLSLI